MPTSDNLPADGELIGAFDGCFLNEPDRLFFLGAALEGLRVAAGSNMVETTHSPCPE